MPWQAVVHVSLKKLFQFCRNNEPALMICENKAKSIQLKAGFENNDIYFLSDKRIFFRMEKMNADGEWNRFN